MQDKQLKGQNPRLAPHFESRIVSELIATGAVVVPLRHLGTVCVDYATIVNKGDAMGLDEWCKLPITQQMGFRSTISIIMDFSRLPRTWSCDNCLVEISLFA